VKNIKNVVTFLSTVMAGRTAVARLRQAREDGDRLELVDALLNTVVVVTGTIIIIRRLRRGEDRELLHMIGAGIATEERNHWHSCRRTSALRRDRARTPGLDFGKTAALLLGACDRLVESDHLLRT